MSVAEHTGNCWEGCWNYSVLSVPGSSPETSVLSVSPCSLLSTRSALQKVSSLICCEFPLEFFNFFLNFYLWGVCACLCLCVSMSVFACLCPSMWCVCVCAAVFRYTCMWRPAVDLSHLCCSPPYVFEAGPCQELAVSARRADKHLPGSACLSASSPY